MCYMCVRRVIINLEKVKAAIKDKPVLLDY